MSVGESLFLDGSNSTDPQGAALTYHWWQTKGSCVGLDETDPARPTFTVPAAARGQTLQFKLVVEANGRFSAPSSVDVFVSAA